MGKTRRSDEESKQEQILELKGRVKLQKKEITRLNRRIRALEKRIDKDVEVKKKPAKVEKVDKKQEFLDKIRKDFGK